MWTCNLHTAAHARNLHRVLCKECRGLRLWQWRHYLKRSNESNEKVSERLKRSETIWNVTFTTSISSGLWQFLQVSAVALTPFSALAGVCLQKHNWKYPATAAKVVEDMLQKVTLDRRTSLRRHVEGYAWICLLEYHSLTSCASMTNTCRTNRTRFYEYFIDLVDNMLHSCTSQRWDDSFWRSHWKVLAESISASPSPWRFLGTKHESLESWELKKMFFSEH